MEGRISAEIWIHLMAPNDLLKIKLNNGQQLFWQIQAIHSEQSSEEALVAVMPLDQLRKSQSKNDNQQAMIPYSLIQAGIEGGTIVHYAPKTANEGHNLRHFQHEARVHAQEARELRAQLHEIYELLGFASSSATPPRPAAVIQRITDLKKALFTADRYIKKLLNQSKSA